MYVELTTDAFEQVLAAQAGTKQNGNRPSGAGSSTARRPVRGLEIKDDTYAIIKMVQVDGTELPLIDSSSPDGESTSYSNFMLQTVQEARMEKHQIVETFGESYIFFFGESPRFLDVQAVILNSNDFNWEAEWWENYNRYLRGTKSVEIAARTYLFYDDNIVEGYILMAQATKTSQQPLEIQLTFRFFVTNYQNISFIGSPAYPIRSTVNLPPGIDLTAGNSGSALIERFRDAARNAIAQSGADPAATTVSDLVGSGLPAGQSISDLMRATTPSFGISPDVWSQISNLQVDGNPLSDQLLNLAERNGNPIRGLISDNKDEYIGGAPTGGNPLAPGVNGPLSALSPQILSQTESDDLFYDSIQFLSCFGADINAPDALLGLGLGPNFSATGGATTFSPVATTAFGFGSTEQIGFPSNQELAPYSRDPLGAVYGQASLQVGVFGNNTLDPSNQYTLGGGDPGYGYPSDFAAGPGYGVAGFGDMGGLGFGGSCGPDGDPGYRDPTQFTFAGVADNRDAFQRFLLPKPSPSVLGADFDFGVGSSVSAGVGAGTAGLSGGAAVSVGGQPSPFSMVALDGTLDETGQARQDPAAVSQLLADSGLGFTNPNPFGVICPQPGSLISPTAGISGGAGIGSGFSAGGGFSVSLP